jgi:hypothetical protein
MSKSSVYTTTKDVLANVDLPMQTRTYKPVSHTQLIDLTLESIHQSGFTLDSEKYSMARDGNVANGNFAIRNIADSEMQLQIGWQNSYDKSLTLKFAMGTHIFICQNGCVSGDMGSFKKKHVGEIQTFTPQAISEYIKTAGDVFMQMQHEREAMKQIELSKRITADLIGRMYIEQDFIESTQLNIIKRELNKPTHNYGADNSLWELYQFTTFAMKEIHPSLWMGNHIDAHRFFTDATKTPLITDRMEATVDVTYEYVI